MSTVYTYKEVAGEQKEPLDYKIQRAVGAVGTAFSLSRGAVGLAFSGGKDSTVLWHLVRTHFPDAGYHVISRRGDAGMGRVLPMLFNTDMVRAIIT